MRAVITILLTSILSITVHAYTYYDIPLSDELQEYTQDLCEEYEVSYPVILAIMGEESRYQADVIGYATVKEITYDDNGEEIITYKKVPIDYGIMQITKRNHQWMSDDLGITDIMDIKQNIHAGIYIFAYHKRWNDDTAYLINAYHSGHSKAYSLHRQGIRQSDYLDRVVERLENLEVRVKE